MLNTPEIRAAFVARFGPAQHPDGPWCVDDTCAHIVLTRIDNNPDLFLARDCDRLWDMIMQNRKTFMLGQSRIPKMVRRPSNAAYAKLGTKVTSEIFDFIESTGAM